MTIDDLEIALKVRAGALMPSDLEAEEKNETANSGKQMYRDFGRKAFVVNGEEVDTILFHAFKEGVEYGKFFRAAEPKISGQRTSDELNKKGGQILGDVNKSIEEASNMHRFDNVWKKHCEKREIADHQKTEEYERDFKKFYNAGKKCSYSLPIGNEDYQLIVEEMFKVMFKHARAETPMPLIMEKLIKGCHQAGYEFVQFSQFHEAKSARLCCIALWIGGNA
ncbi:hypothetical protein [Wolbachia endosymbiont of Ctenocephalides felis wCfeT]|uniref:hypothetical protein n=1 Tax=Wolbachia endosymbiont of Ctenocephalides felis wCfeT TaxID=2732593 RepID=UPI0014471C72|nr:hypothetical protein [Wolbachia endosymbiont of Ctenocephalides felis wCfeT]